MRLFFPFALIAAAPALAQTPQRVEIVLSSFKLTPATITLHHGQRYTLRFLNTAGGGHNFVAKAFFAATNANVANGEIELAGGEAKEVTLVAPAPGIYAAHCSHFLHSSFGMKGTIVVD